jgi:hypothetical protein
MDHLARPETRDDIRDGCEAAHSEPLRDHAREIGTLGVVAANRVLQVRKTGPVLDVQEGPTGQIPGQDVCSAGELVVLVWLVDRDPESVAGHSSGDHLAHGRMDRILSADCRSLSRVDERQVEFEIECIRDRRVDLEARPAPVFHRMNRGGRYAGTASELTETPVPSSPSLRDHDPDVAGEAAGDLIRR